MAKPYGNMYRATTMNTQKVRDHRTVTVARTVAAQSQATTVAINAQIQRELAVRKCITGVIGLSPEHVVGAKPHYRDDQTRPLCLHAVSSVGLNRMSGSR